MFTLDLQSANGELERASPKEILLWAWESLGPHVAATSSFQTQSLPLLHLIAKTVPQLPIFFLDTGFHFPETLVFRAELIKKLGVNVQILKPEMGHERFRTRYGELYRHDPDLCCYINKVEPLQRAMKGLRGWISGVRRDQTVERKNMPIVALQPDGLHKISPMANWTRIDIWQYIHDHQLPHHPLLPLGYLSIGCAPCTRPVSDGEDERSGRWPGREKTECGIHTPMDVEGRQK